MANFKKFNFFIGENNSGKSTVLDYIATEQPFSVKIKSGPADSYLGAETGNKYFEIGVHVEDMQAFCEGFLSNNSNQEKTLLSRLLNAIADDGLIWLVPNNEPSEGKVKLLA